ncbi:MAG: terminase, partial [Alphaproteobacteria bacterium]
MNNLRTFEAVLRQDLSCFAQKVFNTVAPVHRYLHNWHIDAIAWHLALCARGEINRLIITVPPRHLKSICATVAFPAWVLGHDPTKRIVTASYADALAVSHAHLFR